MRGFRQQMMAVRTSVHAIVENVAFVIERAEFSYLHGIYSMVRQFDDAKAARSAPRDVPQHLDEVFVAYVFSDVMFLYAFDFGERLRRSVQTVHLRPQTDEFHRW